MYLEELKAAKEAAVLAGRAIMKVYTKEDFGVQLKSDNSPLTKADMAANKIIVEALAAQFPNHAILSEEEQDDLKRLDNPRCFVVDPLDGTKEFIKRNGQFTVNIALAQDHKVVMGVIYVPVTEELYFAAKGYGSFLEKDGIAERIHVSCVRKEKKELNVVMSSSHGSPEMDQQLEKYQLKNFVKVGSSLKGCMIACGKADVYYRHTPTMEWDTAAMQCIAEEAGAIFRQLDGSPMLYNREDSVNRKGFYIVNSEENLL